MRSTRITLVLLFVAAAAQAQVTESITVNFVEVPVTVVDSGGNPIRGLTKANFEIVDEGKKRPVAGFEAVDFATRDAASPLLTPAARRNFLLLFDLTFSTPISIGRAQTAARQFATQMMNRDDRIAVASIDVAHGFRLLTSFTTDRALVDAAITKPEGFTALDPLQLAGAQMNKDVAMKMDESGGRVRRPNEEMIQQLNLDQDRYNREKVNGHVSLLAGLTAILRAVHGQKHIVLLSEGFDPRLIQGRDAGTDMDQKRQEAAAAESGELWRVDSDNRYGSSSSMALMNGLAEVARRSDVVIDAFDIQGIRSSVDPRDSYQRRDSEGVPVVQGFQHQSNEGLHLLAASTGGTVFQNSNNLADDFRRALKAQEVVYVLAFQAPLSDPRKFHNLKVRLVGVPGGRAIARSGYYEGGFVSAAERNLSNAEIIVNDIPQDGVHIAAVAAPFSTGEGNAQVPVIAEIRGSDIAISNGKSVTLELYTYAFDTDGKVRASIANRIALDMAKVGETLRRTGVKYYETLSLPPGRYAVKTLVRVAETDKKGFIRNDVVVAEKGMLAMSPPLFVDEKSDWVMVRASSDAGAAGYPFQANGNEFIPSAAVHFKGGESRRFVVFVQNATPEELTITTNPEAKAISHVQTANGSTLVFELAHSTSTLNVTAAKRGSAEHLTVTTPIVQ